MKRALGIAVRIAFVVAVVVFAVWGFWGEWPAILAGMAATEPWRILLALALIGLALTITLPVWMRLARAFGHVLPARSAANILYVSQLGKYIPGSVWSVAAQMQLSRRYAVPVRTSLAIGLLFIGVHLASAVAVAGVVGATGVFEPVAPWWACALVACAAIATLLPPVLARIAGLIGGGATAPRFTWITSAAILGFMTLNWIVWAASTAVLLPDGATDHLALILGTTTLAYAAGLAVIIAPAGIGVREGVLVALLAPVFGVPAAATVALLSRFATALVDFAWAGGAHLLARRDRAGDSGAHGEDVAGN